MQAETDEFVQIERNELEKLRSEINHNASLAREEQRQRQEAEKERDELRDMVNGNVRDVLLQKMHFENGALEMYVQHPIYGLFATSITEMFLELKATNYLETRIFCKDVGFVVVTCQKEIGKSPHQCRKEAEAERDAMRSAIQDLPGLIRKWSLVDTTERAISIEEYIKNKLEPFLPKPPENE